MNHPLTDEICKSIAACYPYNKNIDIEDCGHIHDMRGAYDKGASDMANQAHQWLKQNAWKYLMQREYSEEYTINESKLCADFKQSMQQQENN